MKGNKTNKADAGGPASPSVHLEFTHTTAAMVCVAGTFNDWRPEASLMVAMGDGRWMNEGTDLAAGHVRILPGSGRGMEARPTGWRNRPNPFGGLNSVLKVAAPISPKLFG